MSVSTFRRSLVPSAALLLAACGEAPSTTNAVAPASDNGADTAAEVAALPEGQRHVVLLRAIRDAERDCQGVTSSQAAGEVEGNPAWTATCEGGGQWLVILKRGGVATVTSLADLPR